MLRVIFNSVDFARNFIVRKCFCLLNSLLYSDQEFCEEYLNLSVFKNVKMWSLSELNTPFLFRQLWVFGSLLSNFFIDDFAARQYKNCVRILKGSYIVKKCSDNKE